jgi:hypothetical protein
MVASAAINPNIMTGKRGMLRVISPSGLQKMESERELQRKAEDNMNKPEISRLSSHINKLWQAAYDAKQTNAIEDLLLQCRRQRNGEYDPNILAEIKKQGGSEVFMMLTNVKCRAAAAWIRDVLIPPGDKPWSIEPTPLPELPEDELVKIQTEVTQEAAIMMMSQGIEAITPQQIADRLEELMQKVRKEVEIRARQATQRFELKVEDEFRQGNFYQALSEFIDDIVTFPTAFMAGPEIKRRKTLAWNKVGEKWIPQIGFAYVREYRRVSPFDIYPAPSSKNLQDGYLFERLRFRRADLQAMRGVAGFNETMIDMALHDYGEKGYTNWLAIDQERADLENRDTDWQDPDPPIDCIRFWGSAQGTMLLEWGMKKELIPNPYDDYQIEAYKIGRYIICSRLNPHPLGRKPYYSASYEIHNDSIWGKGPPQLMRDVQRICNGLARAIVNNAGIASGPQVEANKDRLAPGEDSEKIWPWKIWKTKDDKFGHGRPALNFYQPDMNLQALLTVFQYFFDQASEQAGIPAYIYGNEKVGGAGSTASGLSMLMNAASKSLKGVISHIDTGVIVPAVEEHWTNIMLFDVDELKTGDIRVVARASEYLIMQETYQMRRMEFLKFTNNPIDMAIVGPRGRATVLREVAKSLKLPQDIVPSDDDMEAAMNQTPTPPPRAVAPGGPPRRGAINPPGAGAQETGPAGNVPGEETRMAA